MYTERSATVGVVEKIVSDCGRKRSLIELLTVLMHCVKNPSVFLSRRHRAD